MKRKKRIIIIGSILFFAAAFLYPYRVKNVLDEIGLTGRSVFFIPCTKTDFYNFDAEFMEKDTLEYLGYRIGFIYDCGMGWCCKCYEDGNLIYIYIYIYNESLDVGLVSLEMKYSPVTKSTSERLLVYNYTSEDEIKREVLDRKDVEKLFREKGTSIEEICEEAMQALRIIFDEWITSNAGKSKFSIGDYGKYSKGELSFNGYIS